MNGAAVPAPPVTGACACGAVTLSVRGEPLRVGICHCTDCRQESGSAFTFYGIWPAARFERAGETVQHRGRHFCPRCGSRLFSVDAREAEVKLGVLDTAPTPFVPGYELWVKRREPWLPPVPGAEQFEEDRPADAVLHRRAMRPRITLVTLGVDDLERAVAFYRDGLGLPTEGIVGADIENGAVAFFRLDGGLKLALWPRRSLAADAGLPLQPASATEVSLAHNVGSPPEVDSVLSLAERAGARLVKAGHDTFYGGYAGYFQDPDGHLWEVAFNPSLDTLA